MDFEKKTILEQLERIPSEIRGRIKIDDAWNSICCGLLSLSFDDEFSPNALEIFQNKLASLENDKDSVWHDIPERIRKEWIEFYYKDIGSTLMEKYAQMRGDLSFFERLV